MGNDLVLTNADIITMNPLYSIHCTANHSISSERLNAERALQLYTLDNARLAFEEKEKGSIEKGKQGDFTIVDGNPLEIPREAIKDIGVDMTIIGGSVVYSK